MTESYSFSKQRVYCEKCHRLMRSEMSGDPAKNIVTRYYTCKCGFRRKPRLEDYLTMENMTMAPKAELGKSGV